MIKRASIRDARAILRLFNQTEFLADNYAQAYHDLTDIKDYMGEADTYKYLVGGKIAGFVMIFFRKQYMTRFLAVDRKHQRNGIGTALLTFSERCARERGIRYIETMTRAENKPIARLLTTHGYRRGGKNYFWYKTLRKEQER